MRDPIIHFATDGLSESFYFFSSLSSLGIFGTNACHGRVLDTRSLCSEILH